MRIITTTTRFTTALCTRALAATLLLTTACDQAGNDPCEDGDCVAELAEAEPTEAQTLAFSKQIVVSDGANEVRLLIASEQQALVDRYDAGSFEIAPIFERIAAPVATGADDEAVDPPHDFSSALLIEEQSVKLEEGAIGYRLHEIDRGFRNEIQSCGSPNVFTSASDFAWVTVDVGGSCTEARISTRKYSWSWYEEKAHASMLCGGAPAMDAGKEDTNRIKLEVCPGPGYDYGFYN
jgi:hypothetical protein